jgi:pentatricopeptide repeat protein
MGIEAIKLFNKVPTNILDNCIYVCVLNACSHSALVDEARKIFEKIQVDRRTEQIYTTMVKRGYTRRATNHLM